MPPSQWIEKNMKDNDVPTLLNRELSLLKFNERVMAMAERENTPLLERLRYLCIVSSNLDEFFEIRISSVKEQQQQSPMREGNDGRTPDQAFELIQKHAHELVTRQNSLLLDTVLAQLEQAGVVLFDHSSWSAEIRTWTHEYF